MLGDGREIGGEVGGSRGTLYSSLKKKNVFSLMWKNPSTLVWPERQNTLATAKRATKATIA